MLLLFSILCFAEPQPNASITIEAHRDIEVYVAPTIVDNQSDNIKIGVGKNSVFGYASMHWHNARVYNSRGSLEPLLLNGEGFKVYNQDTINYIWEGCDYLSKAKECSYRNNHYLLESYITVNNDQLVVELFLYDSDLQVISQGRVTSTKTVTWIKQQAVKTTTDEARIQPQSSRDCSGSSCSSGYVGSQPYGKSTIVNKPKEELPLKWEIPHRLLDGHVQQASLLLWCSTRLKE